LMQASLRSFEQDLVALQGARLQRGSLFISNRRCRFAPPSVT